MMKKRAPSQRFQMEMEISSNEQNIDGNGYGSVLSGRWSPVSSCRTKWLFPSFGQVRIARLGS
jgi:hypothetical protein